MTYLSKINLLHTYYVQSTMLCGGMWNCTVLITCYSSLLHRRVLSLSGSCQNEQLTYKWLLWKGISRKSGGRLEQVKQGRRESQSKNVLLSWSLLWVTGLHPTGRGGGGESSEEPGGTHLRIICPAHSWWS